MATLRAFAEGGAFTCQLESVADEAHSELARRGLLSRDYPGRGMVRYAISPAGQAALDALDEEVSR